MMTRKHFQKIAELLNEHRKEGCLECDKLEERFKIWLEGQNPRFKAERFLEWYRK